MLAQDDAAAAGLAALGAPVHGRLNLKRSGAPLPVDMGAVERTRAALLGVPVVVAALDRLLSTGTPQWTHAHRWSLAKPSAAHDATHHWDGRLGLAGDQWSPDGPSRVESAWRSGTQLARAVAG